MIYSDKKHKCVKIKGNVFEVKEECIYIMEAIYDKIVSEVQNSLVATSILNDMLIKAIDKNNKKECKIFWEATEEEKLAYTD